MSENTPAAAPGAAVANVATPNELTVPANEKVVSAPIPAPRTADPSEVKAKEPVPEKQPAPKAPAKPAPAAPKTLPKVEPFKGLAAAVSLPVLVDAAGQSVAVRPVPAVLGPCNVPDDKAISAALLGGDSAVRGTKHKFELQTKPDQPRVWDALVTGVGSPSVIATFTVGAGNLLFED
jgi:hypothetical protein